MTPLLGSALTSFSKSHVPTLPAPFRMLPKHSLQCQPPSFIPPHVCGTLHIPPSDQCTYWQSHLVSHTGT